jgi:phosphoribosylamine--glycine ligase
LASLSFARGIFLVYGIIFCGIILLHKKVYSSFMKILVIGSGGREHSLVWKLAQSKKIVKVYAAPGNGGTYAEDKAENVPLLDPVSEEGQALLLEFARKEKIDLTLVGPEAPLAAGIADKFRAAGLAIVGPGKEAARLETSKVYSKSFMEKHGIRTGVCKKFTEYTGALEFAEKHFAKGQGKAKNIHAPGTDAAPAARPLGQSCSGPLVIKADGLASGKGVIIAECLAEAKQTLSTFIKEGVLGEAGKNVIIEEFLEGNEVSVMAAVSVSPGKKGVIKPFISARDHKRRFDGGLGPNTGGMGAIAPVPDFTAAMQKDFESAILVPTLRGMEAEKMDYRGFIFFGLMVNEGRCYLLEYNARLGDPETQALLPLMDSDFADLCTAILDGTLEDFSLKWKKGAVCAPVVVADGYPDSFRSGDPIAINSVGFGRSGAKLFIAGGQRGGGGALGSGLRTSGGRVLTISAFGNDAEDARRRAYEALRFVSFEGMAYRKDIGETNE